MLRVRNGTSMLPVCVTLGDRYSFAAPPCAECHSAHNDWKACRMSVDIASTGCRKLRAFCHDVLYARALRPLGAVRHGRAKPEADSGGIKQVLSSKFLGVARFFAAIDLKIDADGL